MLQDKAELYVQIVPLTNADHKKISRNKNNPLQRIKVSNNTSLLTIASYIERLTSTSAQSQLGVTLHAPFNNGCVQLPLSMSVADFLLITSQEKQGELRYKFIDIEEQVQPSPVSVHRPPAQIQNLPTYPSVPQQQPKTVFTQYPKQVAEQTPKQDSPPPYPLPEFNQPSIGTDSMNSIFHTGFHLFSNSFGNFPPNIDSMSYNQSNFDNERAPSDESISLKKDLEQILRK